MIIIILIHFLLIITNSDGGDYCSQNNPFRLASSECTTFENVCYKNNDKQCDELQLACKNCPPSNITLTILQKIASINENYSQLISDGFKSTKETFNLVKEIKNLDSQLISDCLKYTNKTFNLVKEIKNLDYSQLISDGFKYTNKTFNLVKEIKNLVENKTIIVISLLILFITIIILILAIVSCVITKRRLSINHGILKIINNSIKKTDKEWNMVDHDRPSIIHRITPTDVDANTPLLEINKSTSVDPKHKPIQADVEANTPLLEINTSTSDDVEKENSFLSGLTSIQDDCEQDRPLFGEHKSTQGNIKVKFRIPEYNKTIQMYVNDSDSIVKLKKKLCKRIADLYPYSYKIMIFKYNGNKLNDNHCLLSYLKCNTIPICCEFCNNIDHKKICVLKIEGKENFPGLLQINRNDKVKDLRNIISKLLNCNCDKLILYHRSVKLEIDKTINECGLKDNNRINAWKKQKECITVNSLFEDKPLPMSYSDDQKIEIFKRKLSEILKYDFDKMFLYNDGDLMDEKKYFYEYDLDNSIIEYFHPMNGDKIELESNLKKDYLQISKPKSTNQSILLLQLNRSQVEMKEKLLIYHHSKSKSSSLVYIIGIYQVGDVMHIAMNDIFSGTIVTYMNSTIKRELYQIIIWIKQIISGLKYFHENGMYFGYLNPLNILIDGNYHVKILCFKTVSDSFYNATNYKIETKVFDENEFLENKRQPDSQSDVWSLGAILTYIITDKSPEYKLENKNTGRTRRTCHTYEINKMDPSKYLYEFILNCMEENREERLTLDQLKNQMLMKTRTLRN